MPARLLRLIAATWRRPVTGSPLRGLRLRHPAQFVVLAFAMLILLGAGLLMLPVATPGPTSAPPLTALLTATGRPAAPSAWSTRPPTGRALGS